MRYTDLPRQIFNRTGELTMELVPRYVSPHTYTVAGRPAPVRTNFHYRFTGEPDNENGYDTGPSSEVKLIEIVAAYLRAGGPMGKLARCHVSAYKTWKTGRGRKRLFRRYERR